MNVLYKIKSSIESHPFTTFATAAFLIVCIHILTVAEYPSAWFDEIEIIEIGRFSIFDISPEWSVNLMPTSSGALAPPHPYFHYLSGALLEAMYRLTGSFIAGRIIMLLSLPVCALITFFWLKEIGFGIITALATSLLILVDPNATICAHWYRPDIWCVSIILFSLLLISKSKKSTHPSVLLLIAGGLGALSVFFWITAVLILPIIFIEQYRNLPSSTNRSLFKSLITITIGGAVTTAIILSPLYHHIPDIINQYLTNSEIATLATTQNSPVTAFAERIKDFVKISCRSPFIWIAAIAGIFIQRKLTAHVVTFTITVIFILLTRVYHLRMIYLIPYLFLFTAAFVEHFISSSQNILSMSARLFSIGALCFGFLLSVVALNYAAWPEKNTLPIFTDKLKQAIPMIEPNVCILDFEHECYYAGRSLGWKMYSTSQRTLVLKKGYIKFLDQMDAVIISSVLPDITDQDKNTLAAQGFVRTDTIDMPPAATGMFKTKLANIFYAHGYPSCEIWKRTRVK